MRDRYQRGWNSSETGGKHVTDTIERDGTRYMHCKACGFGRPIINDNKNGAEKKLNDISCPPTKRDKEEITVISRRFIAPDDRTI